MGRCLTHIVTEGSVYFYHTDHLGTPQRLTDETGTVVWSADYLPFGQASVTVATVENNLRFAGQYFDQETGLHFNLHRYYDTAIGRYLRADPIGLDGGINPYIYAASNPINIIDPDGLNPVWVVKRIGNWGLKKMGRVSRDEAKRRYRKEGQDVMGSKKMLKKMSKNKGKGKDGKPIIEQHGDGSEHWHQPDRSGGHGFITGMIAGLITFLDFIDPVALVYGDLAGPEDDMIYYDDQIDSSACD